MNPRSPPALPAAMFLLSFALILFELALTRLFAIVLFSNFAHLALALAMLGISAGSLAQHLWPALVPDVGLERALGRWSLALAGTAVGAMLLGVLLPVTRQGERPPEVYEERSSIAWDLVDPGYFTLLLAALVVPFVIAGVMFGGTFYRRKEEIGRLYAADLVGGAFGALAFVPVLYAVSGPDAVFVVTLALGIAALGLFAVETRRVGLAIAGVVTVLSLVGVGVGATGREILSIRYSAGYSEQNIKYVRWTPLTRVAIHEDEARGPYIVLDNTSASRIVRTDADRASLDKEANRSLVWRLHQELRVRAAATPDEPREATLARIGPPAAHVAILAASAGPEVAVAQGYGFTGIEAVDIAPEIGDVVAARFADAPANPYRIGDTQRVLLDGRAAILHSSAPYDVIQMVHANLHSSAGLLADAWSPALLETREAYALYLSRLNPDGMLSFGRGSRTPEDARAAVAALRERGAEHPEQHIALIKGRAAVLLVRPRAWTEDERRALVDVVREYSGQKVEFDPLRHTPDQLRTLLKGPVMTDDRPYSESPERALDMLRESALHLTGRGGAQADPGAVVYHAIMLQVLFVALGGLVFVGVPLALRRPTGLSGITGSGRALVYVACLGYGYLAVETVLIHHLVLFVGHPTYAITVVILAMLLFSGLGSAYAGTVREDRIGRTLGIALAAVVLLGAAQAWLVAPALQALAFGLPLIARSILVFVVLAPLGFVMGLPFPLGMRALRPEVAPLVPWAWALNGYLSVVASLVTMLVTRVYGFTVAFAIALAVYLLAAALAPGLSRVARRSVT